MKLIKSIAVFLFLSLSNLMFAQISFGVRAGLTTNSISMKETISFSEHGTDYTVNALKQASYAPLVGIVMRFRTSSFYFQPELTLSTQENKYSVTRGTEQLSDVSQQKINLSVPLLVGMKFGFFRINAGPIASYLLNSPKEIIENETLKTLNEIWNFGYQAGIGVDISKIMIDLRYEGSLQKYQTQIQRAVGSKVSLDNRPNSFSLTLGWMF